MPRIRALALSCAVILLAAPPLQAQDASDAEARELAAYRLTTDMLHRFETAMQRFAAEAEKDPAFQKQVKLKREIEALEKKEDPSEADIARAETLQRELEEAEESTSLGDANSLEEMAQGAARVPALVRALKSVGMTPRDYALFTLALFQASAYVGLKKAGQLASIPRDVNPANIAFVEQHEAELRAMQERFKKSEP